MLLFNIFSESIGQINRYRAYCICFSEYFRQIHGYRSTIPHPMIRILRAIAHCTYFDQILFEHIGRRNSQRSTMSHTYPKNNTLLYLILSTTSSNKQVSMCQWKYYHTHPMEITQKNLANCTNLLTYWSKIQVSIDIFTPLLQRVIIGIDMQYPNPLTDQLAYSIGYWPGRGKRLILIDWSHQVNYDGDCFLGHPMWQTALIHQ